MSRCDSFHRYKTNIDGFGCGRVNGVDVCARGTTDVLNLGHSGVVKEASRCNERGSTYGVKGTESGSKEIIGINNGSKEVRGYIDVGSKKVGDYTNHRFKKVEGCSVVGFEEVDNFIDCGSK